ncbi:hypothetical protein C823_001823 [Eubacterium plexicaudatum ASF492]|uniref:Uncharacterized protein n=1 Tax=Eubacterium plexicaudatum ASF492 TaxID=1235802 RepID=N2BEV1_9FIRM|nr:hypothetical protein C823_001823 [Eubacterium plexicaudatum ASF492]
MSALIYLASDTNLKEVKSPHNKTMSVNEALALGIEIPDILNSQAIDKDKPDMILWTDSYTESKEGGLLVDSGFADDISILPINEKMEDVRTKKQYCSMVEWPGYTKERADNLIAYMKDHLLHSPEIELWHIWMGCENPPPKIQKTLIRMEQLTAEHIKNLMECMSYKPKRMACAASLPRDWESAVEEAEQDVHYCYVIR